MMPRAVPIAIALFAIFQTVVAIMVRNDVSRCVSTGRSEAACIRLAGG